MNWSFIFLSYASLLALGFGDNIRGPVFSQILSDFSISNTMGAWVFASSSSSALIGSFCGPIAIKYLNRVNALRFFLFLMTLGLAGCSLSPVFSLFIFFSCVFGFGLGGIGVLQNLLAALGAAEGKKDQVLNGLHSMYALASVMAPVGVAALAYMKLDWRGSYVVASAVSFFVLATSYFMSISDEVFDSNNIEIKTDSLNHISQVDEIKSERRSMLILSLMLASYVVGEILVSSRLALYMQREKGTGIASASLYVTGFFIGLLLGRVIFTFLKFKVPLKFQMSLSLVGSTLSIVAGLFYHPLGLAFTGLMMAPFYPLAISFISEFHFNKMDAALSFGLAISALLIVVMHLVVGYLTDEFGIHYAMLVGPLCLMISLLLLVFYRIPLKGRF